MAIQKLTTLEEFEAFVALPENSDKRFELVNGEIIEVPSNAYSSKIAMFIVAALLWFLRDRDWGHVTGEQGGYIIAGQPFAPDVAYISRERQPELLEEGYNPNAPEFAVEVVSPSDRMEKLEEKLAVYAEAGVVTWVIFPKRERVEVRVPGQPVKVAGIDDTVDAGDVLPGFKMAVRDFLKK